jgi:hypothetical protein
VWLFGGKLFCWAVRLPSARGMKGEGIPSKALYSSFLPPQSGSSQTDLHMVVGFSFFPFIYGSRQVRRCRDFMDIFIPCCLRIHANKYTASVDKEASRRKSSNGKKSSVEIV